MPGSAADTVEAALLAVAAEIEHCARHFVAFSGGLDSTVLLHGMSRLPGAGRLIALHVHHGLQASADRWEARCRQQCEAWQLAYRSVRLDIVTTGRGWEAAAREARYDWFEAQLGGGDCLLLAHHQDDQAETVLLRLLRGSGLEGLAAMPRRRTLGAGFLLRPFLELPRSALVDYAQRHKLAWSEDPSNADTRFDRNYLRRHILPLIEARWPAYRKTFDRTAQHLREVSDALEVLAVVECSSAVGDPGFALASLGEDDAIAALQVRRWLRAQSVAPPPAARLREFLRQLRQGDGATLAVSEGRLRRYRDGIYLYVPPGARPSGQWRMAPGTPLRLPHVGRVALRGGTPADGRDSLYLGFRAAGDRLAMPGGRHRDLKSVFQQAAVPPWWRDRVPLLWRESAGGRELLCVGPFARSPAALDAGLRLHWEPDFAGVEKPDQALSQRCAD